MKEKILYEGWWYSTIGTGVVSQLLYHHPSSLKWALGVK